MNAARFAASRLGGMAVVAFALTATAGMPPDVESGRAKAEAEGCHECHGAQGQGDGQADARFPKLAGQHATYVLTQLQRYRDGIRRHDVMRLNTLHLNDDDLRNLAAFYASLPPMRAEPRLGPPAPLPALFTRGDASRGIVACATCHGQEGGASDTAQAHVPRLTAQDTRYLELQLQDWRSGWRTEPGGGLMNQVTRHLTDAEIKALAAHLASQPVQGRSTQK